jgi:hypothetical protein
MARFRVVQYWQGRVPWCSGMAESRDARLSQAEALFREVAYRYGAVRWCPVSAGLSAALARWSPVVSCGGRVTRSKAVYGLGEVTHGYAKAS